MVMDSNPCLHLLCALQAIVECRIFFLEHLQRNAQHRAAMCIANNIHVMNSRWYFQNIIFLLQYTFQNTIISGDKAGLFEQECRGQWGNFFIRRTAKKKTTFEKLKKKSISKSNYALLGQICLERLELQKETCFLNRRPDDVLWIWFHTFMHTRQMWKIQAAPFCRNANVWGYSEGYKSSNFRNFT